MIHPSTEAKILAELKEIGINGTTKEECTKQFVQTINSLHNQMIKIAAQVRYNDECHKQIKQENEKLRKEIESLRTDFEKSPEYQKIQSIRDNFANDMTETANKLIQHHKKQINRILSDDVRRKGFYKPATLIQAAELIRNECASHPYEETEYEGYVKKCEGCLFAYRHEYGNYYTCSLEGKPNKWNLDVMIN